MLVRGGYIHEGRPINWEHPLATELHRWFLCLPSFMGGDTWVDLVRAHKGFEYFYETGYSLYIPTLGEPANPYSPFGCSVDLDGSNDTVYFGAIAMSAPATVSWWCIPRALSTSDPHRRLWGAFASGGAGSTGAGISGAGSLDVWSGSSWGRAAPNGTLVVGTPTHIVLVFTGDGSNTVKCWVNGEKTSHEPSSAFAFDSAEAAWGCKFNGSFGSTWQGPVDDIRVWSRALSEQEAPDVYLNSVRGYPDLLVRSRRGVYATPGVATTPVSASFGAAHEAKGGLSVTRVPAHEAIGPVARALAAAWEATDVIAAAAAAAHEAPQGVAQSEVSPHEAEQAIAAAAGEAHEATQPVAAVAADPHEAAAGVTAAETEPHEALQAVSEADAGSHEALQAIADPEAVPHEAEAAAGSVNAARVAPFEATGVARKEAAGAHESGQPVQQGAAGVHEAGEGVAAADAPPHEATGRASSTEAPSHESTGTAAAAAGDPWESVAAAQQAQGASHEAGQGATATGQAPLEATGRAAALRAGVHESTSVVIPVTAPFVVPLEAVGRIVADMVVPLEAEGVLLDVRERVMRNVEATLRSIALANGFDHDVAVVLRVDDVGFNLDAYPAILIREADTQEGQTEQGREARQDNLLELELGLWIRDEEAPPEVANAFLLDVQRAMMADPRRGGLAHDTLERGSQLIASETMAPFAYQAARFAIDFRHDHDDPFQQDGVAGGGFGSFPLVVGAKAHALSARERIVRDLVAALQAIARANGYQNDVAAVERVLDVPARIPAFPVIFVQETQETKQEGAGAAPAGLVRADLRLTLFVWAREDLAATLPGEVNELLADTKRAVRVDVTRGGVALMTQVTGTVQEVDDVGTPFGLHRVETLVRYRHARNDPSAAR